MGRLYDAFIEVGPRFSGFGDIKNQGAKAGREYGKALADAAAKAAAANVRKLGEALAKARDAEADAAGKVRVAESKLEDVRKNSRASASAIAAAEEQLAAAQRKSAAASNTAKDAAESLTKAQKAAADAAEKAGKFSGNRFSNAFRAAAAKIGGEKEGKQFATRFGVGMNGAIGGIVSRSAGLFVAGFAAVKSAQVFGGFIKDAAYSAQVARVSAQAIKSTGGAAKITADQIGDLATAISNKTGADDETIQSGANLLLTFTNIRNEVGKNNDIFNQATSAVTDMAAALNDGEVSQSGVKSASIQLGKALNDPVKGVTALQKVGVAFTADQKKQIKTLVDSGKTMQAQKIILGELNKEFGGAAKAAGDPFTRLKTVVGNLSEEIGGYLLPYANKFADFVTGKLIPGISGLISLVVKGDFTSSFGKAFGVSEDSGFVAFLLKIHAAAVSAFGFFKTDVIPRLQDFGGFLVGTVLPAVKTLTGNLISTFKPAVKSVFGFFKTDVLPRLKDFAGFIGDKIAPKLADMASSLSKNKDFLVPFVGTIIALVAGLKAWAVIQAVLNAELFANPIGLVVLAIAGLVAGLVYAYKHSEKFRDIVNGAFKAVKAVVSGVITGVTAAVRAVVTAFVATKNAIGTAVGAVASAFSTVRGAIGTAFSAVGSAVGTVVGVVKSAFMTAINFVKSVWGGIVAAVSGPVNAVLKVLSAIWSRVAPILVLPLYTAKATILSVFAALRAGFLFMAGWAVTVFKAAWWVLSNIILLPLRLALQGVKTVWSAIRTAFSVAVSWVSSSFKKGWDRSKGYITGPLNAAKAGLATAWGAIKDGFKVAVSWISSSFKSGWARTKGYITTPITQAKNALSTILGAGKGGLRWVFSSAVTAISAIWNKLQGLAKAPVKFIINTVLNNGLISGFNWIANKFDAPTIKPIPLPKGFAIGGRIPGAPSDTDNTMGVHNGRGIPLATGEFIVNARQTARNLPLLEAINSGGYKDGGLFGSLKSAVTGAFSKGKQFAGDVADFTQDAGGWLKKKFSGPLGRLKELGGSPFAQIVTAVPRKLADTIVGKAKDLLKGLFGGGNAPNIPTGKVVNFRGELLNQRTIAMLLSAEAALRKTFHIFQGSYSTRVSASGSTHAGGGAMDTDNAGAGWDAAVRALRQVGFAAWHRTPAQGPWGHHIHSIAIGDPTASAAAKAQVRDYQHGGDGLGGRARGGRIGVYDKGGRWPSGTLGINTSGQTETVRTAAQEAALQRPIVIHNHIEIGGEVIRVVRTEIDSAADFNGSLGRMR